MIFNRSKKKELLMKAISSYKPTSKSSLKQFCLIATECNLEEAEKLYNFMIKDMEDLPMYDPKPPTWADNTKATVSELFNFIKDNQDTIGQGYEFIRGILATRGKTLPEISKKVIETTEALPKIN